MLERKKNNSAPFLKFGRRRVLAFLPNLMTWFNPDDVDTNDDDDVINDDNDADYNNDKDDTTATATTTTTMPRWKRQRRRRRRRSHQFSELFLRPELESNRSKNYHHEIFGKEKFRNSSGVLFEAGINFWSNLFKPNSSEKLWSTPSRMVVLAKASMSG